MNEVTVYVGAALVVAQILVALFTVGKLKSEKKKTDAEADTSIPVDAANETTAVSLDLARELRQEIKRAKEDCQARMDSQQKSHEQEVKLLREEIARLNGRIKELEQNGK